MIRKREWGSGEPVEDGSLAGDDPIDTLHERFFAVVILIGCWLIGHRKTSSHRGRSLVDDIRFPRRGDLVGEVAPTALDLLGGGVRGVGEQLVQLVEGERVFDGRFLTHAC